MSRTTKRAVITRRLIQAVPVIVLATFIVFALLKLVPGDGILFLNDLPDHYP